MRRPLYGNSIFATFFPLHAAHHLISPFAEFIFHKQFVKTLAREKLKDKSPPWKSILLNTSVYCGGVAGFSEFAFFTGPLFWRVILGELHLARWEEFLIKSLERVK